MSPRETSANPRESGRVSFATHVCAQQVGRIRQLEPPVHARFEVSAVPMELVRRHLQCVLRRVD